MHGMQKDLITLTYQQHFVFHGPKRQLCIFLSQGWWCMMIKTGSRAHVGCFTLSSTGLKCWSEINKQHSDIAALILRLCDDWVEGSEYGNLCGSVGSESFPTNYTPKLLMLLLWIFWNSGLKTNHKINICTVCLSDQACPNNIIENSKYMFILAVNFF